MTSKIAKLIVTAFGTGYAPKAPGTAGSIFGVIFLYFFNAFLYLQTEDYLTILLLNFVLIIITLFIGVWATKRVHQEWKHDSGKIVIDEVVGIFITLLAAPLDWRYYLLGLILFRIFDIWKPLLIRKIDNLHSDWSVMLDDVLAGIYGFIVMYILILILM